MDRILINIFNDTTLSNSFKNAIFNVLNKYQDEIYGYISVGEAYLLAASLTELEKDLKDINLDQKTIDAFVYSSIKYYCVKEKDDVIVWKDMYERLFKDTLLNTINRVQILNIENPNSELVKYLKEAAVLTAELLDLMSLEKPYLVLKKYREIMNLCLYQGLDPSLLKKENEEELKNRLEKKYSYNSKMRNSFEYRNTVSQRKITFEDNFKADNFICFETLDVESNMLQYVMYLLMKKYYEKTGYFLRPLTRDIFLYYLKDITMVAYLYDDVPKMSLKSGKLSYTWDDSHFWAEVYNPKMDYIISDDFNYFIDDVDDPHIFKVVPLNFEKPFYKGLKKVIFTPEKDIDEALFKSLNYANNIELLKQFELDPTSNNLMTSNNSFYFRDPTKVDILEVENLEEHHYLNLIKNKTNETSRKRSISSITAYSKKHPKKSEKPFQKQYTKKIASDIRLPYKDN